MISTEAGRDVAEETVKEIYNEMELAPRRRDR